MNKKFKGRQKNLFKRKLKIMRDREMKNFNLKQTSCKANYNLLGKLKSRVQLVTRAKAKWRTEGEKCSRYFCNLEKTLYRKDYSKINFTRRNRKKQTSLIFLVNINPFINIYIAQQIQ